MKVLKRVRPGQGNSKLHGGRSTWRVGPFKGMPLYSLTLEERATCPSDCGAWDICYGSNMPFATRWDTSDGGLLLMQKLREELDGLDRKHPRGYSLRLHVLGEFFSLDYVDFWYDQLRARPALNIYGYTHVSGALRDAIDDVAATFGVRFVIFQSQAPTGFSARPAALLEGEEGADKLPICPEQTKQSPGCLACGLCTMRWVRGVTFKKH